jgi:hypothetical protein
MKSLSSFIKIKVSKKGMKKFTEWEDQLVMEFVCDNPQQEGQCERNRPECDVMRVEEHGFKRAERPVKLVIVNPCTDR